ncbi:MAG: ORC-CDC6 family AAA ATPase [Verrucomicrobiota bacterium]
MKNISEESSKPCNPFVVESPEKLDVEDIFDLFVEENSGVDVVDKRKHTFVWGPRGSGKSMILRYLEPRCQAMKYRRDAETWEDGLKTFLSSAQPFIGVRIPCKEGYFNKTEFLLMETPSAQILTEHMMNLSLASALFSVLNEQFPKSFFSGDDKLKLAKRVSELFDNASFSDTLSIASQKLNIQEDPFTWAWILFDIELRKLAAFLRQQALPDGRSRYLGATSGYHDFLLPMARAVQELPQLQKIPIYFLVDDADRLRKEQQKIINSWMSNRDHSAICFKVAAQIHEFKTFETRDGWLLEMMHDYTEFHIEELYSAQKDKYTEKVHAITERRLLLAGINRSPEEYLPADPEQEKLFEKMQVQAAAEWECAGKPGRQRDYVYRYAVARLFQELRKARKRRNYAGFYNLVHLSSGVIRYFLEPCYLMFEECSSRKAELLKIEIPPNIQQEVIYTFSEDFLLVDLQKIRKDLVPERFTVLDKLHTLLNSLGSLFYERLTDPDSREARVFSFTIRGNASIGAQEVLDLGVRYRYFQLRTYSRKEGGGREPWYILNRRLCPIFKLDPTGFEGRISILPQHLDLALSSSDQFVKLRLKQELVEPDLFSLELH